MSETQWTPGPWTWFDYPDGRRLLAAPSRAVIHCPDAPMSVKPADATLLAAAPVMYAALEEVVGDFAVLRSDTGIVECIFCGVKEGEPHDPDCTMQHVLAAMRAARGEQ